MSYASLLILGPMSLIANFFRINDANTSQRLAYAAFSLLGLGVVFITCVIFQYTYKRRDGRPFPLWTVLVAYLVAGSARGAVLLGASALGLIPTQDLPAYRIPQALLISVVCLGVAAVIMDSIDRQRNTLMLLMAKSDQLRELQQSAVDRLSRIRESIQLQVNAEVLPVIAGIRQRIEAALAQGSTSASLRSLATQLRSDSNQRVQPMGRDLATQPAQTKSFAVPSQPAPLRFGVILQTAVRTPVSPRANAAFTLFTTVWILTGMLGPLKGLAAELLVVLTNFVVTWLIARVYPKPSGAAKQVIVWIALMSLAGLATAVPFVTTTRLESDVPIYLLVAGVWANQMWGASLIAFGNAAVSSIRRDTAALTIVNARYESETQRLNQIATGMRRRAGVELHGRAQGQLVSCALRLNLAADAGPAERSQALQEVLGVVVAAEHELAHITDVPDAGIELPTLLNQIAHSWRGIIAVDLPESIPTDFTPALNAAVGEIVQEGINNAAKHGTATNAAIELRTTDQWVDVIVTDNGTGHPGDGISHSGAGISAMATLGEVDLTTSAQQTALRVRLPHKM